jgi:hypothetical protein
MPLFSKTAKKSTRLFFATDVHGSERTFRKFINAGKFYQASVLVMGGDITGKMMIPIIREGPGRFRATLQGTLEHLEGEAALQALLERIGTLGFYSQVMQADEFQALHADRKAVDQLFHKLARERLEAGWIWPRRAQGHGDPLLYHRRQRRLPGCADRLAPRRKRAVVACEGQAVSIDETHTMVRSQQHAHTLEDPARNIGRSVGRADREDGGRSAGSRSQCL